MNLLRSYWRWTMAPGKWRKIVGFGIPAIIALAIIGSLSGSGDGDADDVDAQAVASATSTSEGTPQPTAIPSSPTPVPPTATPLPPTPTPTPVVIEGFGQTATDEIILPSPLSYATITHQGASNFAIWLYAGADKDLLVNTIGAYSGVRPVISDEPVVFDITADGAWTITIQPIGVTAEASFSGSGDAVSGFFAPPDRGPWIVTHNGASNFAVWAHCFGGDDLIQNEIGAVDASQVIEFEDGPCFWEVEADGAWSLAPR